MVFLCSYISTIVLFKIRRVFRKSSCYFDFFIIIDLKDESELFFDLEGEKRTFIMER